MNDGMLISAVIGLSAFLVGFSKGGVGGMMGALITALLALVLPVDVAIGMLLPLLIVGDVFAVGVHWRKWEGGLIRILIPGALLGTLIATLFITSVSVDVLRKALGVIIAVFVIYQVFGRRTIKSHRYKSRRWHGFVAGGISGSTSTLAHVGGPPVTVYLLMQNMTPRTLVATSALFFSILNLMKLPGYLIAQLVVPSMMRELLWATPLIPLGVWVGRWAVDRVDRNIFDGVMTFLLAISAGMLVLM